MSSTSHTLRPDDLLEHLESMHRLARALTNGDAAEAEKRPFLTVTVVMPSSSG